MQVGLELGDGRGERDHLDAVILQGARRMLAAALEAEVQEYVERYQHHRDEKGHRQVVRNGKAKARTVTTGAGQIEVEAPRVNDKRVVGGERQKWECQKFCVRGQLADDGLQEEEQP